MRILSPDEADLWAKVTATIRPLSRESTDRPRLPMAAPAVTPLKPRGRIPAAKPVAPVPSQPRTLQTSTLDGSWDRRLGSGRVQPDRTIDLHGHSLDGAWHAIDQGIERAIGSGNRVILLVTGHQRQGEPPLARGRIRAAVYDWLAASRHASHIAAVRAAHRRHGGGGSLYIILRKSL